MNPFTSGLIVLAALAASPALAGTATLFECTMTQECLEQDGCQATQVDLAVERSAGNADPFVLVTPAQTIDGVFMDDNDPALVRYFIARGTGSYHSLGIWPDGSARWAVHLSDAALLISYFGTCEGAA